MTNLEVATEVKKMLDNQYTSQQILDRAKELGLTTIHKHIGQSYYDKSYWNTGRGTVRYVRKKIRIQIGEPKGIYNYCLCIEMDNDGTFEEDNVLRL